MQDKLCEIINHNGIDKQIVVWIEEMSELTKELCKYQRGLSTKRMVDLKLEITDVQICLDQMKLAFKYDAQRQKQNYDYKVERELRREENE